MTQKQPPAPKVRQPRLKVRQNALEALNTAHEARQDPDAGWTKPGQGTTGRAVRAGQSIARLLLSLGLLCTGIACQNSTEPQSRLPVLGPPAALRSHSPLNQTFAFTPFELQDQEGKWITPDSLAGQIIVGDFFFTTCPGICRDQLSALKRIYAAYGQDTRLRMLSHSIDPESDTREVLSAYARKAGVHNRQWLFLRGDTSVVYPLARNAYMAFAGADSLAEGGYTHSGYLSLLDTRRRIRGIYDSQVAADVDRLLTDIRILFADTPAIQPNAKP
jgi:protein SCO1/2